MPALSPSAAGERGLSPHQRPVMLSVWEGLSHSEAYPASGAYRPAACLGSRLCTGWH